MKKPLTALCLLLLISSAIAQDGARNPDGTIRDGARLTLGPLTIDPQRGHGNLVSPESLYDFEPVTSSDLMLDLSRSNIGATEPFASIPLRIASLATARVIVTTTDARLVVADRRMEVSLFAGEISSVSFLVSEPHSGEIVLTDVSTGKEVVRIPYTITKDPPVRQRVSASFNSDSRLNTGYSVFHQESGLSGSASVALDFNNGGITWGVSGSYSW